MVELAIISPSYRTSDRISPSSTCQLLPLRECLRVFLSWSLSYDKVWCQSPIVKWNGTFLLLRHIEICTQGQRAGQSNQIKIVIFDIVWAVCCNTSWRGTIKRDIRYQASIRQLCGVAGLWKWTGSTLFGGGRLARPPEWILLRLVLQASVLRASREWLRCVDCRSNWAWLEGLGNASSDAWVCWWSECWPFLINFVLWAGKGRGPHFSCSYLQTRGFCRNKGRRARR